MNKTRKLYVKSKENKDSFIQQEARGNESQQLTSQEFPHSSIKQPGGGYESLATVSRAKRIVGVVYIAFRAHGMSSFGDGQTGM